MPEETVNDPDTSTTITSEDQANLDEFGPLYIGASGIAVAYFAPKAWDTDITFDADHIHIKMGRYRCVTAVNSDRTFLDEGFMDGANFIPEGTQVKAKVDGACMGDNLFVRLPNGFMDRAVESLDLPMGYREGVGLATPNASAFSTCLRTAMLRGECSGYDGLQIEGLVEDAVSGLLCMKAQNHRRGGLTMRQVRRVVELVNERLGEGITLDEMAVVAGLSRHHFARQFKATVGSAPYEYVLARRLDQAKRLLLNRQVGLSEIAVRCGFADHAKFSNHFRARLGVSPRDYRRIMTT